MLGSASAIPQCLLGGFFFFLPKAIRCVWTPQIADLKFNDVALTARSFQFALGIKWNQGWRDREFVLKLYLIDDGFIWIKRDYWRVKRNNYIFILVFYLIMDIPEFTIMAVHVSIDQRNFSWDYHYASLAWSMWGKYSESKYCLHMWLKSDPNFDGPKSRKGRDMCDFGRSNTGICHNNWAIKYLEILWWLVHIVICYLYENEK